MADIEVPDPQSDEEAEAARTSAYLPDQMNYLKKRFAEERRKLEKISFARKRE